MSFTQFALRFADEAAWRAVATAGAPVEMHEVGTVFAPLPPDAEEGAEPEPLPGYHAVVVVQDVLPAAWQAAALSEAPSGLPLFAGIPYGALPAPITWKSDVWRRCTPEEAAILDAALAQASVQERRLWDDSTQLEHDKSEFATLCDRMTAVFGAERTAVLLAPSVAGA
ncbi:hypothetical protein [Roseomonas xinghualingensis]|uniref:hypothetical protein n=1 Tax=Roseomonas xinghualingensis TaxID=2986475 RepID=UPI0021F0FDBD|nr:hypothetical protein [Roseomonas sp. SXEYE001]MCV4210423.1 hypothetical protein [Roseomonas sp. SXEYE001]